MSIRVYDRATGHIFTEEMPTWLKVGMKMMGMVPRKVHRAMNRKITFGKCAKEFNDPKKGPKLIRDYIRRYKKELQLDDIARPLSDFKTLNEFFQRQVKPRPIAAKGDPRVMVCAADCRLSVFGSVQASKRLWIKGEEFTVPRLLALPPDKVKLKNPAVVIFRLAPQDYHRFHFPVTAVYRRLWKPLTAGEYYSVNPTAVHSKRTNVYTVNKRYLMELYSPTFGTIYIAIIGATCAGSIKMFVSPRDNPYAKGTQMGVFGFGGSTLVMLVDAAKIAFAQELLWASTNRMESLVRMGQWLGMSRQHPCMMVKTGMRVDYQGRKLGK